MNSNMSSDDTEDDDGDSPSTTTRKAPLPTLREAAEEPAAAPAGIPQAASRCVCHTRAQPATAATETAPF